MARWRFAAPWLTLLAGVAYATPALAQRAAFQVERIGAARITVEPGAQVTLAFRVRNRSAEPRVLRGHLVLPADWQLVIPEQPVVVGPDEEELRLLRIALPSTAGAGVYTVRYGPDDAIARDSAVIAVPARHHVTTSVRESPHFVTAGSAYDAAFAIANTGNGPAVVRLTVASHDGFEAQLDSLLVHLGPRAERVVHVGVHTNERAATAVAHRLELSAVVEGDSVRIEPAVSIVEVLPRRVDEASRFRTLPSQLTVRQVDDTRRPTLELRGAGALSPAGDARMEYLLRGPGQTTSLSGEQDEYWMDLSSSRYRLRLGDQTSPYSRLGESWRPMFGASGALTFGAVTVGGFSQRDRRNYGAARETDNGASVDARPLGALLVGAKYTARSGASAGDVWSSHAALTPWRAAALDGEYANGRDSTGGGGAYTVALTGSFPRASYALRRLAADSGFPGLTRGLRSTEASATVVPVGRLSVSTTATDWTSTTVPGLMPTASEWQRAIDGRAAWGELLEVGYRRGRESRLAASTSLDRTSDAVRLYVGVPLGIASLRSGVEEGVSVFDDSARTRAPFRRATVRATVGRGDNGISVVAESFTGVPVTSWMQDDHTSLYVSAALKVTGSTRLVGSMSVTKYRGDHPRTPVLLDLAVTQDLPFGERASWRTRAMSFGRGYPSVRPTNQVDLMTPLGLPVGLSRESGSVRAHVVDRDAGRPLAGVVVHLADRARITDGDGYVSFTGLAEGTHYLEIDRGAVNPDRVIVPATPFGVAVHAGATDDVEIGVVRGARVGGRIRRLESIPASSLGAAAALVDSGPVAGVVVQLSNGTDSVRTSSDAWGKFTFGAVAPGSWTLSVVRADLPRYRRFEQERVALHLIGGDPHDVELRVVPDAPAVRIIAEAELTLDSSATPIAAPSHPAAAARARWVIGKRRVVPPPVRWKTGKRRIVPPPKPRRRVVPPPGPRRRLVAPP
ncbi:MAG TPA: carboxypeptidase-like regulatory domain-containing protein [Gemmatimonadaceae bacterium]